MPRYLIAHHRIIPQFIEIEADSLEDALEQHEYPEYAATKVSFNEIHATYGIDLDEEDPVDIACQAGIDVLEQNLFKVGFSLDTRGECLG